jgi:hypothetical protein
MEPHSVSKFNSVLLPGYVVVRWWETYRNVKDTSLCNSFLRKLKKLIRGVEFLLQNT